MAKLRAKGSNFEHWCPGCDCLHTLRGTWNSNMDSPTFDMGFRVLKGPPLSPLTCRYRVTAGQLVFSLDSIHDLKGETVDMPDIPEGA